jgi:tetratricopeptide (TPR) repeat protein
MRLQERIAQAERDLEEIDGQVANGEIDAETAQRLRARYENERAGLLETLANGPVVDDPEEPAPPVVTPRRLAGAAILVIAAAVLTFAVVQTVGSGESGTEGIADEVASGQGVNLDDISNEQMEQVVAENPDIAPMRLALADRYFSEGEFSNALTHYMYVLDTLQVQDPAALANVGWMTYLSGASDVAVSFVEQSLDIQPDGGIAFWYLANIRFRGLGDPAGAVEPLQRLLEYENLPEDLRVEAEALLAEAEAAP